MSPISHLQTFYLNGISYQPDDFCRCIQRCWILAGQYSFPGMKGYFHDFRKRQNLPDYGWSSFRPSYSSTPIHDKNCFLDRSEEHTSELQSRENLVCRLLLE